MAAVFDQPDVGLALDRRVAYAARRGARYADRDGVGRRGEHCRDMAGRRHRRRDLPQRNPWSCTSSTADMITDGPACSRAGVGADRPHRRFRHGGHQGCASTASWPTADASRVQGLLRQDIGVMSPEQVLALGPQRTTSAISSRRSATRFAAPGGVTGADDVDGSPGVGDCRYPTAPREAGEERCICSREIWVSVALPDGATVRVHVVAVRHSTVDFVELQPIGGGARIAAPMSRIRSPGSPTRRGCRTGHRVIGVVTGAR